MENVHFEWFNQYLYTGEHFQSDLDIFQFDFMFVKPRGVKWDLDYYSQLFFSTHTLWKQELL